MNIDSVEDMRVIWVHLHIEHPGGVIPVQCLLPCLAAIGGFEDSSRNRKIIFRIRMRKHVHAERIGARNQNVGVMRIDDDCLDESRILKSGGAHLLPSSLDL